MLDRLSHWAQRVPDKTAVFFPGQVVSYRQYHAKVCQIIALLAGLDIARVGIAAVFGDTLLEDWLLIAALQALGLDTICPKSLGQMTEMSLSSIAVIVMGEDAGHGEKIPHEFFTTPRIVVPRQFLTVTGDISVPALPRGETPGGHMLVTTGTTGAPKAVLYAGVQDEARNAARARCFGFDHDTVYYAWNFPLYTAVGFKNAAATWHCGGTVVIDPLPFHAALRLPETITSTVLTPAIIEGFASSPRVDQKVLRNATIRLSGGFLSANCWERVKASFGSPVEVYFAATEIIGIIMRSRVTTLDALTWLTPEPGLRVEVVDEHGRICSPGCEGHLRIGLSEIDASHYVGDAAASARTFRDGCFYPGDLAVKREDGRVRVLGRLNDVINVSGIKLAAAPIEHAMQAALAADEVCVFSGPDKAGNDHVVIACRRRGAISEAELAAAQKLAQRLGTTRFVQFETFPLSPGAMQKTDRQALRRMLFA